MSKIASPGLITTLQVCKTSGRWIDASPDDPLAQPTRAELFGLLEEARRPLGSETLARELGLHVNGVRRHLERLEAAGLVERAKAQGTVEDGLAIIGRSLPARARGVARPEAYSDLARWLTRARTAAVVDRAS